MRVVEDGVGRASVDGAAVEGCEEGLLGAGEGDLFEGLGDGGWEGHGCCWFGMQRGVDDG